MPYKRCKMEFRGKGKVCHMNKESILCIKKYFSHINLLLPHTDLSFNNDDKQMTRENLGSEYILYKLQT